MSEQQVQPGELYWQAIEPIWYDISIYDGATVFLEQFQSADPHLRHLLATHWCQSEVSNGGLHQFFWNSTGVLAPEAVEGFLALGLSDCAVILKDAMAVFGPTYPREQSERVAQLDRLPADVTREGGLFDELDHRFFNALGPANEGFWLAADEYARSASHQRA